MIIDPSSPTSEARRHAIAHRERLDRIAKAAFVKNAPPTTQVIESVPIKITDFDSESVEVRVRRVETPAALPQQHATVTIKEIQTAVAAHYGVTVSHIISHRRTFDIIIPRHMAMYLAWKLTPHTLPVIGKSFDRDHTCILASARKIERLVLTDPALAAEANHFMNLFGRRDDGSDV
jgi:chromosomal replication initiation ATPase DnaA